jgi:CRISPR/Cas system-associated exonuclease Cas4 (RecB family)
MLRERLENPRVANWFSGHWTLYNECTILSTDHEGRMTERRPDRIMTDGHEWIVVDFKFGQSRDEHLGQVREYIRLLSAMGHRNISGYLWYVYSNKIVEVSPEADMPQGLS